MINAKLFKIALEQKFNYKVRFKYQFELKIKQEKC